MSIKAVLFDLDGTLLPMDQDVFLKSYLGSLSKKLAPAGYDPKAILGLIVGKLVAGFFALVLAFFITRNDKSLKGSNQNV